MDQYFLKLSQPFERNIDVKMHQELMNHLLLKKLT